MDQALTEHHLKSKNKHVDYYRREGTFTDIRKRRESQDIQEVTSITLTLSVEGRPNTRS